MKRIKIKCMNFARNGCITGSPSGHLTLPSSSSPGVPRLQTHTFELRQPPLHYPWYLKPLSTLACKHFHNRWKQSIETHSINLTPSKPSVLWKHHARFHHWKRFPNTGAPPATLPLLSFTTRSFMQWALLRSGRLARFRPLSPTLPLQQARVPSLDLHGSSCLSITDAFFASLRAPGSPTDRALRFWGPCPLKLHGMLAYSSMLRLMHTPAPVLCPSVLTDL